MRKERGYRHPEPSHAESRSSASSFPFFYRGDPNLDTLSSFSDKASASSGSAKDPRSGVGRAGLGFGEGAHPVGRLAPDLLGFFPQLVTRLVDPFPFASGRRQ